MKIAFNPSTVAALTAPPNNKDITFDLRGQNIFARGVKFCGTDTWRDIKINNVSIGSNILDLRNGSNTTLTNTNGVVTINSTWRPVVDNLTSDSTTSSLSAKQGKFLKSLIDGKSDSGHTHDDRYLRLTGGWMSGNINFGGDNRICWERNIDSASISFKNDGDGDADSYMSFVTSDNGNEYFRWSHISDSTNIEWMSLKGDGLRVGGTKVSLEGHNHDDRYYTKAESNAKYITDITTSVNKLTFTRNGSNITKDITVNNVLSLGRRNPLTERNAISGIYTYGTYSDTDNLAPSSYFETLGFGEGAVGTIEIGGSWISGGKLYWRALRDCCEDWFSWKTILDSSNYSGILDSRYYTESEVNSLLNAKLNRQNLSYGTWNPRGYNLAADYYYNGGDLSISESGGKIHVSVDGYFWLNEGQYRVLDTSDVAGLKNDLTVHLYLSNTDTAWYPLIWGGSSHNNTSDSTGAVYKSYNKLSWLTSSLTLYATNIQTENIKNLSIGGGIYWNPFVETSSDITDAASITLVRLGVAGGTTLVLSLMNDANDTILFQTNGSAKLYHNSYPILTTLNTYVSNNKGYINGTEITLVNNASNARKLVNWYSARPTSLNTQFGDGSLRIFYATSSTTEGKSPDDATVLHLAWDNSGGWDSQLAINSPSSRVYSRSQNKGTWQPWKTLAFTTDIPSSLKNPHALTISLNGTSQGPYDGSAAKNINITPSSIGAAVSNHSHNYAANENYGGFTKSGRLPISGFYQSAESESGGNAPWSSWMHLINCLHSNTGNNYALLIAASFYDDNTFKIRVTNNNVNNAWRDIIHSGNIGSQTVANAYHLRINSANTWSTWHWAGLEGLPSWLWGSNDGTNMYVWNPSNFRVAYASSAGNADTVDGAHLIKNGSGTGIKQVYYFGTTGDNISYIKLGTLTTVSVTGYGTSKVMFTVKGGINYGETNESVYEVSASTRGSIQVTSTLVRGYRELKFGYVSTSSNVEIWMAYDGSYRGVTEVEVSSSANFTLAMTETTTKPSGFVEGSYRILASTVDNVASATKLQTPRTIWGQSFDGTSNINGLLTHIISSDDLFLNVHDNRTTSGFLAIRYFRNNSGVAALHWFHDKYGGYDWNNNCLNLDPYAGGCVTLGRWDNPDLTVIRGGNIGISTTSPSYKLHVNGTLGVIGTITTLEDVSIKNTTAVLRLFKVINNLSELWMGVNSSGETFLWTPSNACLILGTNNSHKLDILANGNVGIGTTSPAYKLHVAGDIYTTTGFKKNGSSDSYVLLGGGGHQTISSLSVNYANSAGYANGIANKGTLDSQEKIDNFITANRFEYAVFNGSNNLGFDGNDGMILSMPWGSQVGYGAQMAFDDAISATVKVRGKSHSWGNWHTLLHSGNYNSYSPTLTGTGASGTWDINITGNADTVDGQHFSYSNSSNSPTYLWATNSNGSSFLAARESISVNYANSAGTANVLLTNNTSQAADACYSENPGLRFWRYNGTSSTSGQGSGDGWIMSWSWGSGSVGGQIYVDDNPSKIMCIRGRNNDANKTFTTWATILHSDNYTSYCAAASHTHPYLPLSGGTMTGTIYFNNMQSGKDAGIDCTLGSRRMLFGIGISGNAGIWELNKGWIMGMDTSNNVFIHGNADSANKLNKWFDSRVTTLNHLFGDGALRIFHATSSVTDTTKCPSDATILHLAWDNNEGWDSLLAVGPSHNTLYFRGLNNYKWNLWQTVLHDGNSSISGNTIKINNTSLTVANSNHNHDNVYLKLAGGTMLDLSRIGVNGDLYIGDAGNGGWLYFQDIASLDGTDYWTIHTDGSAEFEDISTRSGISVGGLIYRDGISSSWNKGRDNALLRDTSASGYHPLWSLKTTNGSWEFGEYNNPNWYDVPVLSYITDSNYNSGNNVTTYQIKFPLASGTVALTSNIPNPTNYYWANVKVSSSPSTTTFPTFLNLAITNKVLRRHINLFFTLPFFAAYGLINLSTLTFEGNVACTVTKITNNYFKISFDILDDIYRYLIFLTPVYASGYVEVKYYNSDGRTLDYDLYPSSTSINTVNVMLINFRDYVK